MVLQAFFSNGGPRRAKNAIGMIIQKRGTLKDYRDRHLWVAPVGDTSIPGSRDASAGDVGNFSLPSAWDGASCPEAEVRISTTA